jgi:hypothetical protein
MKKILALMAVFAVALTMSACESDGGGGSSDTYEYVNKSNRRVTVNPDGNAGFSAFTLDPGQSKKVKPKASTWRITYTPGSVRATARPGITVFDD